MNLIIRPIPPRTKKTEKEIEEEQKKVFERNVDNAQTNNTQ